MSLTRFRRAGITSLLVAVSVGLFAPLAHAGWNTSYRSFHGVHAGAESGNWYAVGTYTQYITQTACSAPYSGRVAYDFMQDETFDDWVAWRSWSCDNVDYTKSYSGIGNGYYYAQVASTPSGSVTDSTLKIYRKTS